MRTKEITKEITKETWSTPYSSSDVLSGWAEGGVRVLFWFIHYSQKICTVRFLSAVRVCCKLLALRPGLSPSKE